MNPPAPVTRTVLPIVGHSLRLATRTSSQARPVPSYGFSRTKQRELCLTSALDNQESLRHTLFSPRHFSAKCIFFSLIRSIH